MRSSRALIAFLMMALLSLGLESPAQSAMTFVHKKKYAMGTVFEIVAYDASLERASRAVEQAFDEVVRFDRMMSNYAPDSELSRLNSSAGFSTQTVSPELYRIIEESLKYSRLSGGKFDVTVGPLVDLWKAAMLGNAPPSAGQEADARACVGYDKVQLIAPNRIAFRSACLRIDLGGIGKGYAVDRAAEVLRSNRIKAALIDAGGSTIYAMGSPPGETGWAVHMRDPSRKVDPTTMLSDASISTSEQTPPSLLANSSAGHIIDPGSGIPLRTRFAVSVVAKTATASDALSTTLLLEGPQEGGSMLQKIRGMAAIWIAPDGESYTVSSGPMIVTGPKLRSVAKQPGSQAQAAVVSKN